MPRTVKVAHICTVDVSLRYLLFNQLRSLSEAGYEMVGVSSPGTDAAFVEAAGIRHIPVPMTRSFTPMADLVSLWRLYRVIRQEQFTIVHTHNPKPGLLGQLAARMAGTPIVVNTVHGFYFHDHMHPGWRRFYVAAEKLAARCSDVILSQNSEDIQTAIHEGICSTNKIKYLGNGIDVQRFDPAGVTPVDIARTRRGLGLPKESPVVGFVGRLVAEKGIYEFLEAARIVREAVPSARFMIVGPIDHEKDDALAPAIPADPRLAEVCCFTGIRQDMPELYALMDVFVLPSHREGFPRSPMEASAMAVPCVVTDIRGCREVVHHSRNGFLVPSRDSEGLAKAIIELLTDTEKARRMGQEGRRIALQHFDERQVFEKVRSEYARLLQEKRLPQQK